MAVPAEPPWLVRGLTELKCEHGQKRITQPLQSQYLVRDNSTEGITMEFISINLRMALKNNHHTVFIVLKVIDLKHFIKVIDCIL